MPDFLGTSFLFLLLVVTCSGVEQSIAIPGAGMCDAGGGLYEILLPLMLPKTFKLKTYLLSLQPINMVNNGEQIKGRSYSR